MKRAIRGKPQMDARGQSIQGRLRQFGQPDQDRLLVDRLALEMANEMTWRARRREFPGTARKRLLPAGGPKAAELTGALLTAARLGARSMNRENKLRQAHHAYWKVTAPAVLLIDAAPPVVVCAALLIQAPPVTRRPVSTRPEMPAATLPDSRFSG